MRKIIAAVVLSVIAASSFADGYEHRENHRGGYYGGYNGGYHNRDGGGNWIAPLIIGGVIGAVIANQNQPPVYQQQSPIYTSPPVYQQAPIYKNVEVYIPECSCYRVVTVQIN